MLNFSNEQSPIFFTIVGVYFFFCLLIILQYITNCYFNYKACENIQYQHRYKFFEIKQSSIWLITTLASSLFFFQFHTKIAILSPNSLININLADPFALIALFIVFAETIKFRAMPRWLVPKLNYFLLGISAVLIFAFFNAVPQIGVTSWALTSRLFGWVVLLGYLSLGYIIASRLGAEEVKRFVEIISAVAALIILTQLCLRTLVSTGFISNINLTYNFEGYSGNRNAFALQLLICICFCFTYSEIYNNDTRKARSRFSYFLNFSILSLIIMGLFLTNSLSGKGALIIILIITFLVIHIPLLRIIKPCLLAVSFFLFLTILLPLAANHIAIYIHNKSLNEVDISSEVTITSDTQPSNVTNNSNTKQFSVDTQDNSSVDIADHNIDIVENKVRTNSTELETINITSIYSFEGSGTRIRSNHSRWQTIKNGFDLWTENPLLGAGLGAAIEKNRSDFKRPIVIHNTSVWILAELGILGFIVIGGMFLTIAYTAWNWNTNSPQRLFIIILLPTLIIISQVHELFYQRILWLSLGLVLAKQREKNFIT